MRPDLHIAYTIQHHGGGATLSQIATGGMVPPAKIHCLDRLMRVLAATGVFSAQQTTTAPDSSEQLVYALTPTSRLLVGARNLAPVTTLGLHPAIVSSFFDLGTWLQSELPDPCMFKLRNDHGCWELAGRDPTFNALVKRWDDLGRRIHHGHRRKECAEVFQGISSLVDVVGGHGAAAHTIAKAFPHVKCSVLDLGHVVAKAPKDIGLQFITGDMFESVPPAQVIFFKWVLHNWGDEEGVSILKNCRKAIPPRDAGGQVLIIDIVFGAGRSDLIQKEMHAVFDLFAMFINGMTRDEKQ